MHPVETERTRLLVQIERLLEKPMIVLSFIWLVLVVVELTRGVTRTGEIAAMAIWVVFLSDFAVKLIIAPRKLMFLRRNVVTVISLVLPAFRLARIGRAFRAARMVRGFRFARLLGSLNRGMRALRRGMRRHGFGYVVTLSLLVLFSGAAGMMAFESEGPNRAVFEDYTAALWWTAMLMTSLGSEYWPRTGPGRALTLVLAMYSLGVFGYITATLASFFIERDEASGRRPRA
ncbi:MAG TPA: ion transporter [Thermoanaerobaculia bacterium]|nr:ion transporter [Thermoanaerobaculia bacterium]